jgi:hypothetical protein
MYQPGELVVYRKRKHSVRPGRRAINIFPARFGEEYTYYVDKFWRVAEVLPNEQLVLVTRRGKEHVISASDPALRRANWWDRFYHRDRFPTRFSVPRRKSA